MRLAFISFEYPPDSCNGGIATYTHQAAIMMRERNWDVEVFAASPIRSCSRLEDGVLVHWIQETDSELFAIAAGKAFSERHRIAPFDVLEGPEYCADARIAKELVPGMPLVVRMHTPTRLIWNLNSFKNEPNLVSETLKALRHLVASILKRKRPNFDWFFSSRLGDKIDEIEKKHAKKADVVVPLSMDLKNYAIKKWGIKTSKISMCPNPYTPSSRLLEISPNRGGGKVVAFIGRLERRKGIEILAKAIPLVCRFYPDVTFRFIGAAEIHPELGCKYDVWLRMVCKDCLDQIQILGKIPLDEMPQVYREVDICVFPSLWENFPNVCLEAMSAARAIIGSSAGGMRDMLDGGYAGMLVKPKDYRKLADCIIQLLRNPIHRAELGLVARNRLLNEYSRKVVGQKMEKIYRLAINSSHRARGSDS